MRKLMAVMLAGLFLVVSCHAVNKISYQIRFGYLNTPNGKTFSFLHEANIVPLLPMSMGAYYGIQIKPNHSREYNIEIEVYMPNGESVNLPKYTGRGLKVIPMGFDVSDSEGEYTLEVFIDGKRVSSIIFVALSPDSLSDEVNIR